MDFGSDDDGDEEFEEGVGGRGFFGFMFGNVDDSGDLDTDYLDEEAKEHFDALAERFGPAFGDMNLSVKLPRSLGDDGEEDYDEKAEDAVNYFDIDEDFEGPEGEGVTEVDHLLPKEEYLSAKVAVEKIREMEREDVEDYDEEIEKEEECEVVEQNVGSFSPLPVLCIDNGVVILHYSKIFGTDVKEVDKRTCRYSVCKSGQKAMNLLGIVEEDEVAYLKGTGEGLTALKHADGVNGDDLEHGNFRLCKEAASFASVEGLRKGTYLFAEPMKEDLYGDLCLERQSPLCSTF